ncbi:single-stranded DNA-binding protein [Amycolatopsis cihanbeyliensis]|uniref:Single-stranded DNA-binding protein n=1 Tax=Amycolatopsis cihanbeyliensis TaxID=1128664 RepID=A0A542CTX0_AMYCI|nr:single-stranded DNA-binding protein [Amycolatopsis cihanbeyliensis]TQI94268.1 single-strand DNA-binding protein [Amycolatopsis cihanbeyliensis]
MAVGETLVTVVGHVCGDLSHRVVGNGSELASFWLRSNERRMDKETGDWVDGRHFAVKVLCWRKLAAPVYASLSKGDPVIVNGRLRTSRWQAGDGQTRSMPQLDALAVGPNLLWCTAELKRLPKVGARGDPDVDTWLETEPGGAAELGPELTPPTADALPVT